MDKNLDKTLQITKETEFETLYSWSIQEVDAEGNVGKDKYIPFGWSLFFDALNISYFSQLKREDADAEDDEDDIRYLNIDDGKIHADLSFNARGATFAPDIRFFGSDRNINNFSFIYLVFHAVSAPLSSSTIPKFSNSSLILSASAKSLFALAVFL